MLGEILSCGPRLFVTVHDPAADPPPEVEPPEPPPGRRILVRLGEGFLRDGWGGVEEGVRASTNAELCAAAIGTLEEAFTHLLRAKGGESG